MLDPSYFLCAENPIATIDQCELEDRALNLLSRPDIQKARNAVAQLWRRAVEFPAREQMAVFEAMITEQVFWNVLCAANGDPGHPCVLRIMEPPCRSFGRDLPGSRWGGDCPDFNYRMIPIEHGGEYKIEISPFGSGPILSNYALMGASMSPPANIRVLDSRDFQTGPSATTLLTIGSAPADRRQNHIQTKPGTHHLLIRDATPDWLNETPNWLRVTRLNKPFNAPRGDDDLATEAVRRIMETCFYAYYIACSANGSPPNVLNVPASSGAAGGMPAQWTCSGAIELNEDEAMIVTVNEAGALYRNVQLDDIFRRSLPYGERTSAFNSTQMVANGDGNFTYVIAHEDPAVHNWLDTGGRRRTLLAHRWQHFAKPTQEPPRVTTRVVKFHALAAALPATVKPISAEDRRRQLEERLAGFNRRLAGRATP